MCCGANTSVVLIKIKPILFQVMLNRLLLSASDESQYFYDKSVVENEMMLLSCL